MKRVLATEDRLYPPPKRLGLVDKNSNVLIRSQIVTDNNPANSNKQQLASVWDSPRSKKRARDMQSSFEQYNNDGENPRLKRRAPSTFSNKVQEGDGSFNSFLRSIHVENAIHRGRCGSLPLGSPMMHHKAFPDSVDNFESVNEEPYNMVVDLFWVNKERNGIGIQ